MAAIVPQNDTGPGKGYNSLDEFRVRNEVIMTALQIQTARMTIAEFAQRYEEEGPFEIDDGEATALSPQISGSAVAAGKMFAALSIFLQAHPIGQIVMEAPFVLVYDESDWVRGSRVPDLMFYSAAKFAEYTANDPDWESKPFVLIPDLAIEIISPTDRYTEVSAKVERYLADGVRLVWILDRRRQIVEVRSAGTYRVLTASEMLSAEDLLPGFEVPVASLFS